MNCANHIQTPAAAYCRTCGKPLCTNCTRPVMGVIYCENCLAEKVSGTAPSQMAYQQGTSQGPGVRVPPGSSAGPNPALAGILGAIPFGVGAIYNGQYAKGLAHLGIFILLVIGANQRDPLDWICGIGIAAFVIYQIFDSVRTAKAIQANQPVPDPFGLATMFSPGDRTDFAKSVPTGAVVLIALGVLFLLHNLGFWFVRADVVLPVFLIALGVWLFARRVEAGGHTSCGKRGIVGPAVLVTLGVQFLLSNLGVISFGRTLPALLIVIGVALVIQRSSATTAYPYTPTQPPPSSGETQPPSTSTSDVTPSTEVKNG